MTHEASLATANTWPRTEPDAWASALRRRSSRGRYAIAACLALGLHFGVAAAMPRGHAALAPHPQATTLVDHLVDVDLAPPPREVPEQLAPKPPKPAEPLVKQPAVTPASRSAANPAPAQAAQVVTQKAEGPVDFGDSMVVGKADTYAGGASAANGTSTRYTERASPSGTANGGAGAGAPPAAPGPDLSRKAKLGGGHAWSCPFPSEADLDSIDHAVVSLQITVDESGRATSVRVVSEPGHGFGREARTCAISSRYEPARNAVGAAITATLLVNVRFDR
jgi:protein TonB